MFEDLDELARGLAENSVSRRQAMKWAGYSVLGATLSSMGFAETAEALTRRQRRRCRAKLGIPLAKGECHCAFNCESAADFAQFTCQQDHPECGCFKTIEGKGFCANGFIDCGVLQACSHSSQCPKGFKCVASPSSCCGVNSPVCYPPCGTGV